MARSGDSILTTMPPRNRVTSSSVSREINRGCWSLGQNDGSAFVHEGVERMQKLILSRPLRGQEVNVVDDQTADTSITGAKAAQGAGAHRFQEAVGERLGGEQNDVQAGVRLLQGVGDAFEQVSFTQSDGAVDHQRVERTAGRLGHLAPRRGRGGCLVPSRNHRAAATAGPVRHPV